MNTNMTIGIFGKLPAHGDFIHRNLPSKVINEWDSWLQTFVGSTQERLGDNWLEIYLTSPIWRFCLSSGVFDDNQWAGIVLPSVDRVGRYFPFSIMAKLPPDASPCDFIATQQAWFESVENLALTALDGQLQVDPLVEELNKVQMINKERYQKQDSVDINAGLVVDMDFQEPSVLGTMPHLLDAFVKNTFNSYSIWSTLGSEKVEPCSFIAKGMPPVAGASAMLDGLWEHWEWSVPVRPLDTGQHAESVPIRPIDTVESMHATEPVNTPEAISTAEPIGMEAIMTKEIIAEDPILTAAPIETLPMEDEFSSDPEITEIPLSSTTNVSYSKTLD